MSHLKCGKCGSVGDAEEIVPLAKYRCRNCDAVNEVLNVPVREWLGFDFQEYLEMIKLAVDQDDFKLLKANSAFEVNLGKLNEKQINRLKSVLKEQFDRGGTIRDIRTDVLEVVKVKDLQVMKNGKVQRVIPKEVRSLSIARTETTRMANLGSQKHYENGGVVEYSWVASLGSRTCPICIDLDGQVFPIGGGPLPPAHGLCRCTTIPVVEL